jgi:hypothetical protein
VRYGEPFVVLTIENPVAPVSAPSVADVVLKPAGVVQITPGAEAKVQYLNWIEPTEAVVGSVN